MTQQQSGTAALSPHISTCLITLCLCLWTALHLNIPEHRHESSQKWRKLGWLMLGLIAPEMVVYTALEQQKAALRLTNEMLTILGDTPEPRWWQELCFSRMGKIIQEGDGSAVELCETRSQALRHQWTHIHSFYAFLGGFAFDTREAKPNFLPNGRSHLALRFEALKHIANVHLPSFRLASGGDSRQE